MIFESSDGVGWLYSMEETELPNDTFGTILKEYVVPVAPLLETALLLFTIMPGLTMLDK